MPLPVTNAPAAAPRYLPSTTCHTHSTSPSPNALSLQADALAGRPRPVQPTEPLLLYSLTAPTIDPHALVQIRCERPKRDGAYRLEATIEREQFVVHHYGHGGSGWTLGLGTTAHALQLFEQSCGAAAAASNEPLTVVGGGFIGLYTALNLAERYGGERVRVVAERFDTLASHKAGGLLAPISLEVPAAQQHALVEHARDSLALWQQIAAGRIRNFVDCARPMPVYVGDDTDAGLDVYYPRAGEEATSFSGLLPRPQRVLVQFDTGGLHNMWRQPNVFMDTQRMMERLTRLLAAHGVELETSRVRNLTELDSRYVFNCTGLGARTLLGDERVYPVHGHLIGLGPQPTPERLEYMIYTTSLGTPAAAQTPRSDEACYFMPKSVTSNGLGVLGGTFEPGELDEREHLRLLDGVHQRAVQFFHGAR